MMSFLLCWIGNITEMIRRVFLVDLHSFSLLCGMESGRGDLLCCLAWPWRWSALSVTTRRSPAMRNGSFIWRTGPTCSSSVMSWSRRSTCSMKWRSGNAVCLSHDAGFGRKDRLIDWLIDRWIDWLIDWLMDWLIDWLIDGLMDLIDWLIDWLLDWLIDWWTDWVIDWLIDWLMDWWTDYFGQRADEWLSSVSYCPKISSRYFFPCKFHANVSKFCRLF